MAKDSKNTNSYVNSIIQDIQNHFVKEKTLKHSNVKIERIYEFEDGAVIKYEWQDAPRSGSAGKFNHRFTLESPPKPNPNKLKKGVIRIINYPDN
jgi:hypothetical protein